MIRVTFAQLTTIANFFGTTVLYDMNGNNVRSVLFVNPYHSIPYNLTDSVTESNFLAVFTTALTKVDSI